MAERFSNPVSRAIPAVDAGLRRYMLGVYNYMAAALGITGLVAFFVSTNAALMQTLFTTGLMWVVLLAPLALVFYLSFRFQSLSFSTARNLLWLYAALVGLSLAPIFIVYTSESIARVFFISGGTFAGMSIYGYATKRDLTGLGSFLIMGLWGLILAMIVNLFVQSTPFGLALSAIGVLIFVGLTAYDTQRIKEFYYGGDSAEIAGKKSVFGALMLYLDFLNIFLNLLRLMGDRR
ncbi:MAG: Bax inhibitor-1 family protein [Dongiaceae bacterium]